MILRRGYNCSCKVISRSLVADLTTTKVPPQPTANPVINSLHQSPDIHLDQHTSLQYIYQTSWYFSKNISLCINTLLKCNSYRFCSDWNWTMFGDCYAFLIGRSKGLKMLWGKNREGRESNHLAVVAQWQSTGKSSQRCPGFSLVVAASNHEKKRALVETN